MRLELDETAYSTKSPDKMAASNGFSTSRPRMHVSHNSIFLNANLMTTGMSSFGEQMNTTAMHAHNNLKIKRHNKATMVARIKKLNVEDAKSKSRIK